MPMAMPMAMLVAVAMAVSMAMPMTLPKSMPIAMPVAILSPGPFLSLMTMPKARLWLCPWAYGYASDVVYGSP